MSNRDAIRLMNMEVKRTVSEMPHLEIMRVLWTYIDYLENVARDAHLQARLSAEAVGGNVPDIGRWTLPPSKREAPRV